MTTVDSCPKTLPMPSVGSWNSTTETHLLYSISIRELGQPNILAPLFFLISCQTINLLAITRWDTISIDASTTFSWKERITWIQRITQAKTPNKSIRELISLQFTGRNSFLPCSYAFKKLGLKDFCNLMLMSLLITFIIANIMTLLLRYSTRSKRETFVKLMTSC